MILRLDKFISDSGKYSRREARQLILSGRVSVDGRAVVAADYKFDENASSVRVDGEVFYWRRFRYIMMDKPAGLLTARADRKQGTVMELLPEEYRRFDLAPVGRLDKDTTGLLLITDDGDYAHRVISSKYDVWKTYRALTDVAATQADVLAFSEGILLSDGTRCLPAELEPLSDKMCLVRIREGKYHQVKRMLASRGMHVLELRRLAIGMLQIDENLESGGFRELGSGEAALVFAK